MLINRKPHLPPGRPAIASATIRSPFMPLNTRPKAVAPIRIKNTMLVRRVVWRMASCRFFRFSFLCAAARIKAPIAPTAADSVGEATPKKMEPSTAMIRSSGGRSVNNTAPRATPSGPAGSAGALAGL